MCRPIPSYVKLSIMLALPSVFDIVRDRASFWSGGGGGGGGGGGLFVTEQLGVVSPTMMRINYTFIPQSMWD